MGIGARTAGARYGAQPEGSGTERERVRRVEERQVDSVGSQTESEHESDSAVGIVME